MKQLIIITLLLSTTITTYLVAEGKMAEIRFNSSSSLIPKTTTPHDIVINKQIETNEHPYFKKDDEDKGHGHPHHTSEDLDAEKENSTKTEHPERENTNEDNAWEKMNEKAQLNFLFKKIKSLEKQLQNNKIVDPKNIQSKKIVALQEDESISL